MLYSALSVSVIWDPSTEGGLNYIVYKGEK